MRRVTRLHSSIGPHLGPTERLSLNWSTNPLIMYPGSIISSANAPSTHLVIIGATKLGMLPGMRSNWLDSTGAPSSSTIEGSSSETSLN
jgi:hypothetical protein